jgi:hypothetical protein
VSEAFLHYLWKYKLFDFRDLVADDGSKIEIIKAGLYNTSSGPDFFNARIKINGTLWAGNVEIHILSSDWLKHNHQADPAYDSCILHVVYKNDVPTKRMNGSTIPTIELCGKFAGHLWENYLSLISKHGWVACEDRIAEISKERWENTISLMIEERLTSRADQILIALKGNKGDWQETFYQYLSKNFGFQINGMPFEMLARSLPLKILLKERKDLSDIEALLFGQAGMLDKDFEDNYPRKLREKYDGFKLKYKLKPIPFTAWKFMRLRPVNFPSVRIAQLARLIYNSPCLFDEILRAENLKEILAKFDLKASGYWDTHYRFDMASAANIKKLGKNSVHNIIINTCAPLIYAWGKSSDQIELISRSVSLLRDIPAEENHLISRWKETGVKVNNAVESQALLQLKMAHCSEKKCLTCNIGSRLINTQIQQ